MAVKQMLLPLSDIASLTPIPSSVPINRLVKFNRSCLHSWGCTWQAGDIKPKQNNPTPRDNGLNRHVTELKTLNLCWIICLQRHTCSSVLIKILPVLVSSWLHCEWWESWVVGCVDTWWTDGWMDEWVGGRV